MIENIPDSWRAILAPICDTPAMHALEAALEAEAAGGTAIYPPQAQRFRALEMTPPDAVRVVILGQDPYHGPGQAHGLAFSVPEGQRIPPSLRNIFKERAGDIGHDMPTHGNLDHWAQQGVLLLNTALSVAAGKAGSHAKRGWQSVTDAIVQAVADRADPTVFILWGNHAQGVAGRIAGLAEGTRHLVLASVHPSPLSARRGFFGSRPFSRANAFLEEHGRGRIDW
ncbi:MAG: uracil-DNA glycosylase [Pontixanthobacter sp.]